MVYKKDIDSEILFAFERICTAFRALIWDGVKETNLSPIQLQFIVYLKKHPESMRNVSAISAEFELSKATVSDSLKALQKKNLISRKKGDKDRRFSTISLTEKGERVAKNLEDIDKPFRKLLENFPQKEKERAFSFLVKLIDSMRKEGIIKVARMCISCFYFKKISSHEKEKPYLCKLTGRKFSDHEINIDCSYYKPVYL